MSESSPPPGADPQWVGPYRLLRRIGCGAMGCVYEAEHPVLGRRVALKLLRPELAGHDEMVGRFLDEARATNVVESAHVVRIIDVGDPSGPIYLVMDLLEGESLASVCEQGPLTLLRALEIARQLCDALGAVHRAGMVHRDLKPENVFLSRSPHGEHVKLLDFGVAKVRSSFRRAPTLPGVVLGTPIYMSPEQALGADVDHRSDLHALGVLLCEMLSGELLGEARGLQARPGYPDLSTLPGRVRQPLQALLARCLERDPDARPQSAEEAARAIDRVLAALHASPDAPSDMRPAAPPTSTARRQAAVSTLRVPVRRPRSTLRVPTSSPHSPLRHPAAWLRRVVMTVAVLLVALAHVAVRR